MIKYWEGVDDEGSLSRVRPSGAVAQWLFQAEDNAGRDVPLGDVLKTIEVWMGQYRQEPCTRP